NTQSDEGSKTTARQREVFFSSVQSNILTFKILTSKILTSKIQK
ncbi:11346_t:CDS:1, partial [Gigaspora rosea]